MENHFRSMIFPIFRFQKHAPNMDNWRVKKFSPLFYKHVLGFKRVTENLPCPTVCDGAVTNHVHSVPVWRRNSTCRVHKQISGHPCLIYEENITKTKTSRKFIQFSQNFLSSAVLFRILFCVLQSLFTFRKALFTPKVFFEACKNVRNSNEPITRREKNKVLSTLCRLAVHKILLFVGVCLEIIISMTSLMSVDQ